MAKLTIDVPADKVQRVLDAFESRYSISQIEDPENPGEFIDEYTSAQWTKLGIIEFIKRTVQKHEMNEAKKAVITNDLGLTYDE